jgi:hypothetical protein
MFCIKNPALSMTRLPVNGKGRGGRVKQHKAANTHTRVLVLHRCKAVNTGKAVLIPVLFMRSNPKVRIRPVPFFGFDLESNDLF